jgi:hypothetical protein
VAADVDDRALSAEATKRAAHKAANEAAGRQPSAAALPLPIGLIVAIGAVTSSPSNRAAGDLFGLMFPIVPGCSGALASGVPGRHVQLAELCRGTHLLCGPCDPTQPCEQITLGARPFLN